MSYYLQLKSLK